MAVSVAIIGAGAAGLAAARRLLAKNCNVVLFESQRSLGGVWQTANEDSALYAALRTNLPKEVMAFDDLPFHRCVIETASHRANDDASSPQQKETSFVSAVDVQRYLEEYARVYNLAGVARMGSKVTHVVPMKRHDDQQKQMDERIRATQWRVTWQDISTGEQTADTFDSVVVCNGHYNERAIPKHLSLQAKRWNGRTMHSKDYNTPDDFAGLVVVIVGAASSGRDLALDLSSVAKEVHVCDPQCPALDADPSSLAYGAKLDRGSWKLVDHPTDNLWQHPALESLPADTSTVQFAFGDDLHDVDVVIWATGYVYSFPFLSEETVRVTNQAVRPLFEQCIHVELPSLFFIGLPFSVVPFPMMDAQAMLCADLLTGQIQLPSPEQLRVHEDTIERGIQAGEGIPKNWHQLGAAQWDYVARILLLAGEMTPQREGLLKWRKGVYNALAQVRASAYPGAVDTYRDLSLAELEEMAKSTSAETDKASSCL